MPGLGAVSDGVPGVVEGVGVPGGFSGELGDFVRSQPPSIVAASSADAMATPTGRVAWKRFMSLS